MIMDLELKFTGLVKQLMIGLCSCILRRNQIFNNKANIIVLINLPFLSSTSLYNMIYNTINHFNSFVATDTYMRPFFSSFALQQADEQILRLTKKMAPLWKALISFYNMDPSTFREACMRWI